MPTNPRLLQNYQARREEIEARLREFSALRDSRAHEKLSELCFCVCAANSSARSASAAQKRLEESGLLYSDDPAKIAQALVESGVRFHNNKARYIVSARKKLFELNGLERMRREHTDEFSLRDRLAEEIDGLGLKEAGHFMRNTGLGTQIAILDRHILKNLHRHGAIKHLPTSLTPKTYRRIERQMLRFAKKTGIPPAHLDLLFWSEETGRIFK